MENERGSVAAITEIVKLGRRISVRDMAAVAEAAEKSGGSLVSVDPDGDWCGTGRIHFPWPPKKTEFASFLDHLVASRINFEVLINGIPVPRDIMVQVSRGFGH